jgi:hypothetical protein
MQVSKIGLTVFRLETKSQTISPPQSSLPRGSSTRLGLCGAAPHLPLLSADNVGYHAAPRDLERSSYRLLGTSRGHSG